MQFNEKSRKFALDVMTHLEAGPLSPADFVTRTGASRAKVMRMLAYLLEKGVVIKTQVGPKALYAKPQPLDFINLAKAAGSDTETMLSVALSVQDANLLVAALDTVTRFGLGQWTVIAEEFRWDTYLAPKDADLDALDKALSVLKCVALGFSGGGSWGIFSPNIYSAVTGLWGMQKAIRHRLAWDRNPEGGMGVYFDEPMGSEVLHDFTVTSLAQNEVVSLCMTTTPQRLMAVKIALGKYVELAKGHFDLLLDDKVTGLCPKPLEGFIALTQQVTTALAAINAAMGRDKDSVDLELSPTVQRIAAIEKELEGLLLGAGPEQDSVVALELPPVPAMPAPACPGRQLKALPASTLRVARAPTLEKLGNLNLALTNFPQGFSVSRERGAYQLLRANEKDDSLVIIGNSYSLQTALCMLKNASASKPLRTHTF